ncbi:carboxypeptidase-like regulatory domain-containing protein [Thalassomonas haliotis]|uniref:Big-1 domain-containing protein n=1 Tax=Thalassomonas haliotis TaxID=485448 RepID=A0ABY7VJ79_9GAMM|nr:carboxypeptidase-like regulatory domain-containing protein [Thalassomonas haliotis]WDE13106.1 hypothetical protein H3N35_06580 [Thalassomonas haliotis]
MNTIKEVCRWLSLTFFLFITQQTFASAAGPLGDWMVKGGLEVEMGNPVRSRRSPDASVDVRLVNSSNEAVSGPVRLVIDTLTPDLVSISNGEGELEGKVYFTLIAEDSQLLPGDSSEVKTLVVSGGGDNIFEMAAIAYVPKPVNTLVVDITSPDTLLTVGSSPVLVSGTINTPEAQLTLNGVVVNHNSGTFSASVELVEGFNTLVARATTSDGQQVTDSIVISLDLTPPYLTIESHQQDQEVYSDKITVTGLVNDIVRGTVEAEQARVEVNGMPAVIANRSYAAIDVPLTEGENTITVTGVDQAGNSASVSQNIFYKQVLGGKLTLVSGQDQSAEIGKPLANPLSVKLIDGQGAAVPDETVVFRVTQGAGIVGADTDAYGRAVIVTTDAQGMASTVYQLGYRTGVANHKVKAKVVGYENEIIFHASATSVTGDKISINSGNNQRGIAGQNLPAPFVVAVTDSGANTVNGARVRFDVLTGGGKFQNGESSFEGTTDSDGRLSAQLTLGELAGIDAQRVQATLIDAPEGQTLTAGFMATAFVAADPGQTRVTGIVLDNQDTPIPGVTVRIEGTDRIAATNAQGQFTIAQAPVGPVHIIADGSTATVPGEYPALSYHLVTVAGVENPLSAPIYMVKLDTENAVLAGSQDAVLTLDSYPGFKLEIAKDSVTFPDGSREGYVSVTAVNASKVPMAPPNGMQPQFIVTIQPVGATFEPAAKLTLPNVDGHAPGAQVEMYSFDHDLEEFVAIGLGSVSEDGSIVTSNPGVGVVKAGWHCGSQPGGSGCAHNCPTCEKCENCACVPDPSQDNVPLEQQTPGDCQKNLCKGPEDDPSDVPTEDTIEGDCKKPGCDGGSANMAKDPDDNDIKAEDATCKFCSGGNLENKPDQTPIDGEECKECVGGAESNKADGTEVAGEECKECKGGQVENKADGTEIEGEECKECKAGQVDNKAEGFVPDQSNKCKICKDGSLVNKTDPDQYTPIPADPNITLDLDRAKPLTDAIAAGLRRMGINASVGLEASVSYKQGPCCNPETGDVKEDEVTEATGAVGLEAKVEGRIPGLSAGIPSVSFDRGGFTGSVDAGIGVRASISLKFTGQFGQRYEDCIGEGDECAFGQLAVNFSPALSAFAEAIICVAYDALGVEIGGCVGVDGVLTISSGVSYNKSMNMGTCSAGTTGGGQVDEIAVSGSIKIILGTDDFGVPIAKVILMNAFPI